jgi:guanylate kinase
MKDESRSIYFILPPSSFILSRRLSGKDEEKYEKKD